MECHASDGNHVTNSEIGLVDVMNTEMILLHESWLNSQANAYISGTRDVKWWLDSISTCLTQKYEDWIIWNIVQ